MKNEDTLSITSPKNYPITFHQIKISYLKKFPCSPVKRRKANAISERGIGTTQTRNMLIFQ